MQDYLDTLEPPWIDDATVHSPSIGRRKIDLDTAKKLLAENGLHVTSEGDLNNGMGVQLRTAEGPILNVYKTGKCVPGGKNQQLLKPILEKDDGRLAQVAFGTAAPQVQEPRKVFVVYGHDGPARTEIEAMLRRWELEPLILEQLPSKGPNHHRKIGGCQKRRCLCGGDSDSG